MTQQTKPTFTPGPWTKGDFDPRLIVGPQTRFLTDAEGRNHLSSVCLVDRSNDEAEDLANATLIAAAPELLAALERLTARYSHFSNGEIKQAVDAIALARKEHTS